MDSESDEYPAMWVMFSNPLLVLFEDLEHAESNLETLMNSIVNSTPDFGEVLVPRQLSPQQQAIFSKWLLNRLFYLFSVDKLSRIHITSKKAQLKLLSILYVNGAKFFDEICNEYIRALDIITKYYAEIVEDRIKEPLVFEMLIPEAVDIPNSNLNFPSIEQVIKPRVCKNVLRNVIEIISEITLFTGDLTRGMNNLGIIENELYILEHFHYDLKISVIESFLTIFNHYGISSDWKCLDRFFLLIQSLLVHIFGVRCGSVIESRQIGLINELLTNLFILVRRLQLKDAYVQTVILNTCKSVLNIDNNQLANISMDLKRACMRYIDTYENTVVMNDDYYPEYVRCMPSTVVAKILSEINEQSNSKNAEQSIEVVSLSRTFQRILSMFRSILDSAAIDNIDEFIINEHIDTCWCVLNVFQSLRIEFYHQWIKNDDTSTGKRPLLSLIAGKNALDLIERIMRILTLNKSNGDPKIALKCVDVTLLLITLTNDVSFEDLSTGLYIDPIPFSTRLKIFCLSNIFNNSNWCPQLTQMLSSVDCSNDRILIDVLNSMPLLLLNKVITPFILIDKYIRPVFASKNNRVVDELISNLPIFACILHGFYAIVQSKTKRRPCDFEYKLSEPGNAYFVCLHCYDAKESFQTAVKLNQNKTIVIHEKSQLVNNAEYNFIDSLKSLFEELLNINRYGGVAVSKVSKLIITFSRHSIILPSTIEQFMSQNSLGDYIGVFDSLTTNILNNASLSDDVKNSVLQITIDMLLRTTRTSLEQRDYPLQENCIEAIHKFRHGPYEKIILPSIKLLTFFVMHPDCPYGPKAAIYIINICKHHGKSPEIVYHSYKKDLGQVIMNLTAHNYLLGHNFTRILVKVIRIFGFNKYEEFISKDIHHSLPFLISSIVRFEDLKPIIPNIAESISCTAAEFISDRFPHIYVHIYLKESEEMADKCFEYISNVTDRTLESLIQKHSLVLWTKLLLQYCSNPQKVIKACKYLAQLDTKATGSSNPTLTLAQVADFIQPRFLGILASFDCKLGNVKIAISVKRKALQSFSHLLNLMGSKHLTPLRYKILATLRTALSLLTEYPDYSADAWNAYVRNIETTVLGPMLIRIFISLIPLLPNAPVKVNEIFEYLVVGNENILSCHIEDLFFLEDTDVSQKVKAVVSKHISMKMPVSFIDKIKWHMKYLNQNTIEMKVYTLKYLYKLIKDHRIDLDNAIFNSQYVNPCIVELLDILLTGCQDKDAQLSDWSGRCLGQFGALQPSLLPRQMNPNQNATPFTFNITEKSFAKMILIELARGFQSEKNTKELDCYSLAIQEILNAYEISPENSNKDIWDSFPEHMHQIMIPLLSSRYILICPVEGVKTTPIYGSNHATTFNQWVLNWGIQMIPLIKVNTVCKMLKIVYPALKKDSKWLTLFLPYIMLHAIFSSNDATAIKNEILSIIQLKSFNNESVNVIEIPKVRMMRTANLTPHIPEVELNDGTHMKCCKTIYNLLDFLHRWKREWCHVVKNSTKSEHYMKIDSFLGNFCKLTIAKGNFLCGDLERALLYLEMYMEESPNCFKEQLSFLAEIYAVLNEPDAVSGILSMKQNEPTLSELILAHEVTGQLQDAATCYEKYAQQGNLTSERLHGMVEIYLGLDQPFTALQLLHGANDSDFADEAMSAESFWRLGMFDELDKLLKRPEVENDDRWGVTVGHCLLAMRNGERQTLEDKLKSARSALIRRFDEGTSYMSAEDSIYSRGYNLAFGLHMISEIEHIESAVFSIQQLSDSDPRCTRIINELIDDWNLRFKLVQTSAGKAEPILRLQRILLEQSKELLSISHPQTASLFDRYIGKLWLQSAKFARKANIYQQAYIYILNGEKYAPKELFIEKAKLYWKRTQQETAFSTLKRGLEEHFADMSNLTKTDRKTCAKAKLLIAMYNDEHTNVDMDLNIAYYKKAVDAYREWEKSLVCLGGYYEKVYAALNTEEKRSAHGGATQAHALDCYGRALQHGHSKLYQSMPRMLSIWLDFEIISGPNRTTAMTTLVQICQYIETFTERLPLHLFLTAFSQIISRVCHPVKEVYVQLKAIIIKLIIAYPQYSLWMMISVIKSSYPQRIRRCQEILNDARLADPTIQKFIHDFKTFAEKLIELTNSPIADRTQYTTVSALVKTLPKLLAMDNFSQIIMPHEQFIKMVLPFNASKNTALNYDPFPSMVYIAGIEDQVTIISSMQKPRKVTLRGSDGKPYIIMLKPKDDLRKDFRLMEFNAVVNRYLQEDPDARERRLYIRTYAVLPLNEECGLIQWIPNLVGLRPILLDIYKDRGIDMTTKELRQLICDKKDTLSKKQTIFTNMLLPRHPPVFGEWFRFTFIDPHSWYQARSAYIRTTAVMSMVGYVVGLGDRHGENILYDSTNGDTVHVDFNCLFNQGETLNWPERVPFRLTHNMQAAMGPLGYEGMFRKCCEVTMCVLRTQTPILMSVIRPFVYDPLVGWQKSPQSSDIGERTNQSARNNLMDMEQRLQGTVRTKGKQFSLQLSPEGQINYLILEAVNVVNLCQMYIGWGPYL